MTDRANLSFQNTKLLPLLGERLSEIWIIVFVPPDKNINWHQGNLELIFGAVSEVVHFKSRNGGDSIELLNERWIDPFAYPDKESLEFVMGSGKWTKVEMSNDSSFAKFIGKTLSSFRAIRSEFDKVVGFELEFDGKVLTTFSWSDENLVLPYSKQEDLEEIGWSFGPRIGL